MNKLDGSKRMKWESTPLLNIIQFGEDRPEVLKRLAALRDWQMTIASPTEEGAVNHMKSVWGRQDYCMTTYRRYWVWEGENWRIFTNRDYGIGFEVREGLTPDEAWAEFEKFKRGER